MTNEELVAIPAADVKVIIGVLANVEAHLMDPSSPDPARHLTERLHRDLARYGQASSEDGDRAALAAITQRLHTALGDIDPD